MICTKPKVQTKASRHNLKKNAGKGTHQVDGSAPQGACWIDQCQLATIPLYAVSRVRTRGLMRRGEGYGETRLITPLRHFDNVNTTQNDYTDAAGGETSIKGDGNAYARGAATA